MLCVPICGECGGGIMSDTPLEEQSIAATTPDGSVFARVAAPGHLLGVQLEPAVMRHTGAEIAQRVMACAEVAYLEGQVRRRDEWAGADSDYAPEVYESWMPTRADLSAARARLEGL